MKCKSKRCEFESGHKGACSHIVALRGAINTVAINGAGAINSAINEWSHAINAETASGVKEADAVREVHRTHETKAPDQTANRRDRAAYNAYMRDYMRRRRASA